MVVPREAAQQVLERLTDIRAAEALMEADVKAGLQKPDFLEAVLRSSGVEEV